MLLFVCCFCARINIFVVVGVLFLFLYGMYSLNANQRAILTQYGVSHLLIPFWSFGLSTYNMMMRLLPHDDELKTSFNSAGVDYDNIDNTINPQKTMIDLLNN